MKAFKYKLHKVLNVRNTERDMCIAKLASANRNLIEQQNLYNNIISKVNSANQYYIENFNENTSTTQILNTQNYLKHLDQLKEEQLIRIAQAEKEAEKCREVLVEAKIEVGKFEKHSDRTKRRWLDDYNKEENKEYDERATTLHYLKSINYI